MIKTIAFVKRKAGISREEFARHYEEVHAPLAAKLFPTFRKYVRNHIVAVASGPEPDFDCISEFWFDDAEGYQAVLEVLNSEAGKVIHADEETFMDTSHRVSFVVDQRVSRL